MATLTTVRIERNQNYTSMSNYHLRDIELSLKAKGLMSFMLALPPDWDMSIRGLATCVKENKDTVMKILKELEEHGYLIRTQLRDGNKFAGYQYILKEQPSEGCPKTWDTSMSDTTKSTQINTNINNNLNNKNIYIVELTQNVIDYLNGRAKKNYKATTGKTKSLISARHREGFVLHDFKTVIDKKCSQWLGTDMEKYLRPETLFGTKFEGYLNEQATTPTPQSSVWNNYGADSTPSTVGPARSVWDIHE